MTTQYTAYLSHSWLPDHVDLNRHVWDLICADVRIVVDAADDVDPPYYINRMESELRRSDLFLAILAVSDEAPPGSAASPFQLFEMDLATRSGLPRLVLRDDRLAPPTEAFRSSGFEIADFTAHDPASLNAVRPWLARVMDKEPRRFSPLHRRIGVLVDDGHSVDLREASQIVASRLDLELAVISTNLTDAEVIALLRGIDVLVAELGEPSSWATYGMAHGLMVPSIRLVRGAGPPSAADLPAVLQGQEAGYLLDLVGWSGSTDLVTELEPRVACLYVPVTCLDDRESGHAYFERRR